MKKLWMLVVVACAALFVACSVESKAEEFAEDLFEAVESGNFNKASELIDEIDKYMSSLSGEDLEEFSFAFENRLNELGTSTQEICGEIIDVNLKETQEILKDLNY